MNVLGMLKPKYSTTYLEECDSLREGLTIMKASGYTAVPVIDRAGRYVGTVSEGDFLWHMLEHGEESLDSYQIKQVMKKGRMKAAREENDVETLIEYALFQNFVPMVDDRNCYIGIITRRDIIQNLLQKKVDSRYILFPNESDFVKK